MTLRLTPTFVRCSYLVCPDARGFEPVRWMPETGCIVSRIRLDHLATEPRNRPNLLCPSCGAMGRKLYLPLEGESWLACRDCHQLSYHRSQERRISIAKVSAQVHRQRRPLPSLKAMHRQPDRLRARVAATLAAAGVPAGRSSF